MACVSDGWLGCGLVHRLDARSAFAWEQTSAPRWAEEWAAAWVHQSAMVWGSVWAPLLASPTAFLLDAPSELVSVPLLADVWATALAHSRAQRSLAEALWARPWAALWAKAKAHP